jgi:phage terminase small subunit
MLTANQEEFVKNIIAGMSQADAYRSAYPKQKMSDKTVWEAASRLMKNDKVVARLSELRKELAKPSIKTAQERLEWLTKLIDNVEEGTNEKLKAIDIMNKMDGLYVQKISGEIKIPKLEDLL